MGFYAQLKEEIYSARGPRGRPVARQDNRLETVDDIDLERVVIDRGYRRRVIAFLNRVDAAPDDPERVEAPEPSRST